MAAARGSPPSADAGADSSGRHARALRPRRARGAGSTGGCSQSTATAGRSAPKAAPEEAGESAAARPERRSAGCRGGGGGGGGRGRWPVPEAAMTTTPPRKNAPRTDGDHELQFPTSLLLLLFLPLSVGRVQRLLLQPGPRLRPR